MTRTFGARREELLQRRAQRQREFDAGRKPSFPAHTQHIREAKWKVAPIPHDLMDRRVEITGPVDRKMIINALNSGANVFMADFEDSNAPTWSNILDGQVNLCDAVRRRIRYVSPEGKSYQLVDHPATLFVRPRGWHLSEKHVKVDGKRIPAISSTSACTSFTTHGSCWRGARARVFICPSWKAIWRLVCGTTSSYLRRNGWAFRAAPSARRC